MLTRMLPSKLGNAVVVLALAASFALLACVPSPEPRVIPTSASPAPTATPYPLRFPDDHAAHNDGTEWWYYSGHVESGDGASYGFHVATFLTDGDSGRRYARLQASVVDLAGGASRHWTVNGIVDDDEIAPTGGDLLDIGIRGSRVLIAADGSHRVSAVDPQSDVALDLTLSPTEARMLHDGIGWVPFPLGASYYYTLPRMPASGTLRLTADETIEVDGSVWYDHQWGDFIVLGWPSGWYWAGLQLDDGSSLMFSEVRDTHGDRFRMFGTYLAADGSQRSLDESQDGLSLEHLDFWSSDVTAAEYPVRSRLVVESLGLDLVLEPASVDQEVVADYAGSVAATYWEGSVSVLDGASGAALGRGYLELAGYARRPSAAE